MSDTQTDPRMKQPASSTPKSREPWLLRPWPMLLVVLLHISLFAAIACLAAVSRARDGFASIGAAKMQTLTQTLGANLSILWTALPSLIFQVFVFIRSSMADDAAAREPFAQLGQTGVSGKNAGGNGRVTILANYRYMTGVGRWHSTMQNKHWHLSLALSLSFLMRTFLVPLAASLITVKIVTFSKPILVNYPENLDMTQAFASRPGDEWVNVLISVASEILYGARPPPWTSSTQALQPFRPAVSAESPAAYQVTAPSKSYAASLDCQSLGPNEYQLQYSDRASSFSQATLTSLDRGCALNQTFSVDTSPRQLTAGVFHATRVLRCADASWPTRMFFLAATTTTLHNNNNNNNNTQPRLDRVTVFSCTTLYTTTSGAATASWSQRDNTDPLVPSATGIAPESADFTNTTLPVPTRPGSAAHFENALVNYGQPLHSIANNFFGGVIINAAAAAVHFPPLSANGSALRVELDGGNDAGERIRRALLDPRLLHDTIVQTFAVAYRTAVARIAFRPVVSDRHAEGEESMGVLRAPEARLMTRYWVAMLLLAGVALSLASMVWLGLTCLRAPLLMSEVPESVLAYAALLLRGGGPDATIAELVADVDGAAGWEEGFVVAAARRWAIQEARFSVDPKTGALRAENLRRRAARTAGGRVEAV